MASIDDVRIALESALTSTLSIPAASIAWKGKPFDSANRTTRWYRPTFMPGKPDAAAIGVNSKNRFVFIFQIDIFDPNAAGEGPVSIEAARIIAAYKRGTVFTKNAQSAITIRAYRSASDDSEAKWIKASVLVEGWADVAN